MTDRETYSEGAREMVRHAAEVWHTDWFSAHGAAGHGCTLVRGEPCDLCLRECGCMTCYVRLTLRVEGGGAT